MNSRRSFIKKTALGAASASLMPFASHGSVSIPISIPKISLAQWSLHRAFEKGEIKAVDFAQIAKNTYGISAVEYVNQFYVKQAANDKFWLQMKSRADDLDVKSLLIMVDNEGDLGNLKDAKREKAVENHYKWINAAKLLGCHSIRVNAFGEGEANLVRAALVDGLGELAAYGEKENINVIIENHGLHTSNGEFMTSIIKEVDNPYLGTLPDFGNWCLNAKWGSTQNNRCTEVYDRGIR